MDRLKTHIADAIRNGIIEGMLKPGQQLQQDKIAAAMGVSPIPVREALSALKEERLVDHFPNRGTFVAEMDADKVREAFEIRFFLESGALSLSLPKIKDEDLESAQRLLDEEQQASCAKQKTEFDLAFHKALCRPCRRPHLMQLIEQIHGHTARYVNIGVYLMNFKRHPEFNHAALFNACKDRQLGQVVDMLRNHFNVASDLICKRLEL